MSSAFSKTLDIFSTRIRRNDAMFAIQRGEATHHSRSEHH